MATDEVPGSRKRRLFRAVFGLRTLLVAVLIIGGGLGWIVHTARAQREAMATVRRLGGFSYYEWERQISGPSRGRCPGGGDG